MKNEKYPLKGIYKAIVLSAEVLPDRESPRDEREAGLGPVKYGFNCIVAAYDSSGKCVGNAEGGGVHNLPLTANSPAIKCLRALQDTGRNGLPPLPEIIGACMLVEIETKIIPALGARNIITQFISRKNMTLADWEA